MPVIRVVLLAICLGGAVLAQPRMISTAIRFTDVTAVAGVDFVHSGGSGGAYRYVEQLGAGAAFLDYDNDGWLDLFLAQGAPLPGFSGPPPAGNVLYRNDADGTFTDVTAAVGLTNTRFTIGVATGDYDDDGDADLVVTTLDGPQLYRNQGGKRFVDVTAAAGIRGTDLLTTPAFVDYDNDGRLDLFIARYGRYDVTKDAGCADRAAALATPPEKLPGGRMRICEPSDLAGISNLLFRNKGNGTFEDVSAPSGVSAATNHGFGVATADYNEDGRVDIFVASDMLPNLLFINRGNGTFEERALPAGIAVGAEGRAYAGMGVDAGDYNGDGHIDLFITNFEGETSSLYRGAGDGTFADESQSSAITALSLRFLKWGCRFLDLDHDLRPDLFVVNGHVNQQLDSYAQKAQVYRNVDGRRFEDVSLPAGPFFQQRHVSRGAAFGDYDNDGDLDVVITNNQQKAVLLRNDTPLPKRWIRIVLRGQEGNRDALGAVVRVTSDGPAQTQVVKSAGSYLSDHDRRLLFALPPAGAATAEIRWPCGLVQRVPIPEGVPSLTVRESGCRRVKR